MTPQKKAQQLVNKFTNDLFKNGYIISKPMMKQCASIAAGVLMTKSKLGTADYQYWRNVKAEIEKL